MFRITNRVLLILKLQGLALLVFILWLITDVDEGSPPRITSRSPSDRPVRDDNREILHLLPLGGHVTHGKLGNFSDFRIVVNAEGCPDEDNVYMLILVGSHPSHTALRNVIRQNLTMDGRKIKMIFLFGRQDDDAELLEESKRYGDIVQGNFIDSYHNVTLRDMMGLRWAWKYCPRARYVMHLDDDVVFDTRALMDSLKWCCSYSPIFIGCYKVWRKAPVNRDGRYAVSLIDYPNTVFDDYCSGWMYVVTPLTAYLMDWVSSNVKHFWMNDVYITGSLVRALNVKHIGLSLRFTQNLTITRDMLSSANNPQFEVVPTGNDVNLTLNLIQFYKNRYETLKSSSLSSN